MILLTEEEMNNIIDDEINTWVQERQINPLYVITDIGDSFTMMDEITETEMVLPRYGVWTTGEKGEIIETSNDLEALKKKYNVNEVIVINK